MQRQVVGYVGKWTLVAGLALGLAGCGGSGVASFDSDNSVSNKMANLLAFNSPNAPAQPTKVVEKEVTCPDIQVLEGTAAHRVYAGGQSSSNVRYQYSLGDVARECTVIGNQISIKVGVEGKVLLGPAGSPGAFNVPVRMAIVGEPGGKVAASKIYRIAASIGAGQTSTSFSVVSEPLIIPYKREAANEDYTIKVGFDGAGGGEAKPAKRRR